MSMAQNLIIGMYIHRNSIIHKIDPRVKIITSAMMIAYIFSVEYLFEFLYIGLLILSMLLVSKISFNQYLNGLKPILFFILLTIIFNLFFTEGGNLIFQLSFIKVYSKGLYQAIFTSLRLILLFLVASILTITTSPFDMTLGLEKLLSPLKLLKIPVSDFAFMITVAFRFIPILIEQAEKIEKAQRVRGASLNTGKMKSRLKSLISIIIPIFIHSFRRADELAIAMEARGYRSNKERTRMRELRIKGMDLLYFVVFVIIIVFLIYIRRF